MIITIFMNRLRCDIFIDSFVSTTTGRPLAHDIVPKMHFERLEPTTMLLEPLKVSGYACDGRGIIFGHWNH